MLMLKLLLIVLAIAVIMMIILATLSTSRTLAPDHHDIDMQIMHYKWQDYLLVNANYNQYTVIDTTNYIITCHYSEFTRTLTDDQISP